MAYLHQTQSAGGLGFALARNAVQLSVAVAAPRHRSLVRL